MDREPDQFDGQELELVEVSSVEGRASQTGHLMFSLVLGKVNAPGKPPIVCFEIEEDAPANAFYVFGDLDEYRQFLTMLKTAIDEQLQNNSQSTD